jgi:hypothetical protein
VAQGGLDRCTQGSLEPCSGPYRCSRGAIGSFIGEIESREIAADGAPAHLNEKVTFTGGLGHEVSILLGAGRHFGSQPRAKTSMTIMRAVRAWAAQHRRCVWGDIWLWLRLSGRRINAE